MTDLAPQPATPSAKIWALIPCAGTGSRAGLVTPKQYQILAGAPLVLHTLAAFGGVPAVVKTLVVVAQGDSFFDVKPALIATVLVAGCGGPTRAASVFNGLTHLLTQGAEASDWVLVHDAARCLVTPVQINALIDACQHDDVGGLLAHKLPDTLKSEAGGRVLETIDRNDKWLAQTPQMFRIGALQKALEHASDAVTDESSAMEALGLQPKLVPGSAQNFKVTYPEDFALAQAILLARQQPAAFAGRSASTASQNTEYDYP